VVRARVHAHTRAHTRAHASTRNDAPPTYVVRVERGRCEEQHGGQQDGRNDDIAPRWPVFRTGGQQPHDGCRGHRVQTLQHATTSE
jgi:hypothetical protein